MNRRDFFRRAGASAAVPMAAAIGAVLPAAAHAPSEISETLEAARVAAYAAQIRAYELLIAARSAESRIIRQFKAFQAGSGDA